MARRNDIRLWLEHPGLPTKLTFSNTTLERALANLLAQFPHLAIGRRHIKGAWRAKVGTTRFRRFDQDYCSTAIMRFFAQQAVLRVPTLEELREAVAAGHPYLCCPYCQQQMGADLSELLPVDSFNLLLEVGEVEFRCPRCREEIGVWIKLWLEGGLRLLEKLVGPVDELMMRGWATRQQRLVDEALLAICQKDVALFSIVHRRCGRWEVPQTLQELAAKLNRSRDGVRNRESWALRRMRRQFRQQVLEACDITGAGLAKQLQSIIDGLQARIQILEEELQAARERVASDLQRQAEIVQAKQREVEINYCGAMGIKREVAARAVLLSLSDLGLSVRTHNALKRAGLADGSLGLIVIQTAAELLLIRNFGQDSLQELRKALRDKQLALRGESPSCE